MKWPLSLMVAVMTALGALGTSPLAAQETGERSWLALGDSYSSGEGIPGTAPADRDGPGTPPGPNSQGRDCRRATGIGTDATAWAVGAYNEVAEGLGLGNLDFVACTGALTDEVAGQIGEAMVETDRDQWDLLSSSFGGNNIGFTDVLEGCLDLGLAWDLFDLTPGCDLTERELRHRVDMLTGQVEIAAGFEGSLSLPSLFDLVAANQVAPGGDVIVVGYPHLIEEVGRWDRWRRNVIGNCEGIERYDVGMLRSVTGYLNEQIALAIRSASQRHRADGVRFHFLDISRDPYEQSASGDRHALCSDDPWLNGLTTGLSSGDLDVRLDGAFHNSFHPTQTGHTNTARVLASYLHDHVTFDDTPLPLVLRGDGLGLVTFGDNADLTISALTSLLGPPTRVEDDVICQPPDRIYRWDSYGLDVRFDPTGAFSSYRYNGIPESSDNPPLRTAEGIGIGSTPQDIRAAYPDADYHNSSNYVYAAVGGRPITIVLGGTPTVGQIKAGNLCGAF